MTASTKAEKTQKHSPWRNRIVGQGFADPSKLIPNPKNWRLHPKTQRGALEGALNQIGWVQQVVVNKRTGNLIDGHLRVDLAIERREQSIPIIYVDLNDEEESLVLASIDPLSALALADKEKLKSLMNQLAITDPWLSDGLGKFARLAGVDPSGNLIRNSEPKIDEAGDLEKKWGTAEGQLWTIGSHKLLCGDSTKKADVQRLFGSEKARLCATDPPYLVDYTGKERPNDSGKDWTEHYNEIEIKDATGFFRCLFVNILEMLDSHSAIYCWHAHKRHYDIIQIWRELDILDHQQIVWVKPTPVFGRVFWHFRHEPCLMGWKKGSIPTHDGDKSINSVWEIGWDGSARLSEGANGNGEKGLGVRCYAAEISPDGSSVWEIDWEGKARIVGNKHPTQKPLEIFMRPIRKHTFPGDIVFEPFSGSGSQLVAAENTGRVCYAIELSPAFVAVALDRMEATFPGIEISKFDG